MEQTRQDVANVVRQYLQNTHPGGTTLEVVETGIRQEEFAWHVPVQPNVEPPKLFEYYEALTDVENRLVSEAHLKVFLIPAEPKQELAA